MEGQMSALPYALTAITAVLLVLTYCSGMPLSRRLRVAWRLATDICLFAFAFVLAFTVCAYS